MRVYLRALEYEDCDILYKWRNDPEVSKYLGGNVYFVSKAREKKWLDELILDDKENLRLGICIEKNRNYIGNVNLTKIEWINRKAEFSIFIGTKEERGKGYGKEATILMLHHGFTQMNLNKIYLYVNYDNVNAIKLYKTLGFKKEGELKDNIFKYGKYHTQFVMSIFATEFHENNDSLL